MSTTTHTADENVKAAGASASTFCAIPWVHRHTNEQGVHHICCVAVGEGNILRDSEGNKLHVSQRLTNEQVLNSPRLKAARSLMLRGEWPEVCKRCQLSEESGSGSVRQDFNRAFAYDQENLIRATREDGSLDHPVVRYADIRLGNVCNLTCMMCGPEASRLWADSFNVIQPAAYRRREADLRNARDYNWVKHEPLKWLIDQCLPSIQRFHFAGGEPLLIPEMVDVLEQCVASGRSGEIDLSYNTNITVLPEKVTSLWKHFRSVFLFCSIDGFGRLNDYIRRPSEWHVIDRNLRKLDDHFEEWKLVGVQTSATVQIYNVLTIHELYAYLRESGFRRLVPIPQLVPLFDPHYLSTQALPARIKDVARERLRTEMKRAESRNREDLQTAIGSIRTMIAYMDAADTSSDLPDFFSFCEASDKAFGGSWREAAPELAGYLHSNT